MKDTLLSLRSQIARYAQFVYDNWEQVDGICFYHENGGICGSIALAIGNLLKEEIPDVCVYFISGVAHEWIIVEEKNGDRYEVDIPWEIYEENLPAYWKKVEGVRFSVEHVKIWKSRKRNLSRWHAANTPSFAPFDEYVED